MDLMDDVTVGKLRAIDDDQPDEPDDPQADEPERERLSARLRRHLRRPGMRDNQVEPEVLTSTMYVGLDLGKNNDRTSLAFIRHVEFGTGYVLCRGDHDYGDHDPDWCQPELKTKRRLVGMHTITQKNVSYPEQARLILDKLLYPLLDKSLGDIRGVQIWVDVNNAGDAVVTLLKEYVWADGRSDISIVPVMTLGGAPDWHVREGELHKVSKAHLMSQARTLVEVGLFEWVSGLAEAEELRDEIRTLVVTPSETASGVWNVTYGAAGSAHDDRVLALAYALLAPVPWQLTTGPSIWV